MGKFPISMVDGQYQVGCYITSHPEIYRKIKGEAGPSSPFDWYFQCKNGVREELYLSSGFSLLVRAALDLFNGYRGYYNSEGTFIDDHFSLYSGVNTWDDNLYRVFRQALDIGSGRILYGR
jgi:hypothetical protein